MQSEVIDKIMDDVLSCSIQGLPWNHESVDLRLHVISIAINYLKNKNSGQNHVDAYNRKYTTRSSQSRSKQSATDQEENGDKSIELVISNLSELQKWLNILSLLSLEFHPKLKSILKKTDKVREGDLINFIAEIIVYPELITTSLLKILEFLDWNSTDKKNILFKRAGEVVINELLSSDRAFLYADILLAHLESICINEDIAKVSSSMITNLMTLGSSASISNKSVLLLTENISSFCKLKCGILSLNNNYEDKIRLIRTRALFENFSSLFSTSGIPQTLYESCIEDHSTFKSDQFVSNLFERVIDTYKTSPDNIAEDKNATRFMSYTKLLISVLNLWGGGICSFPPTLSFIADHWAHLNCVNIDFVPTISTWSTKLWIMIFDLCLNEISTNLIQCKHEIGYVIIEMSIMYLNAFKLSLYKDDENLVNISSSLFSLGSILLPEHRKQVEF